MAKIITRQTSLKKAFWKRAIPGLILAIGGIYIIVATMVLFPKEGIVIGVVIGAFIIGTGASMVLRNKSFLSGAKGEKLVCNTLANFPDDWYIFNDVVIRDTQIDHILICPKGVYAIETKNYRGTISGDAESPDWWQLIQVRQARFYNPIRQSHHHAVALANYFRESGYSQIWVEEVIVFSHPEVKLKVTSSKTPVIYLAQLTEFLDNRDQIMSSQECEEISANLNNHLTGNIKKNRLTALWLPLALIIIMALGGLWLANTIKSKPTTEPIPTQDSVISWEDVSDEHIDQIKIVEGKIVKTEKRDKVWYLNFHKNYNTTFTIVIFEDYFKEFSPSPDKYDLDKDYRGKMIRVRGRIEEHKYEDIDRPEIKIKSPKQIETVE